jgi:uncharacterized protein YdaU (DUF1376 family)
MAKDPAFLFYSKDWLEGTMELTAEEKGVYIDLLAHQHQKGSLPSDTKRLCKLVGMAEAEFLTIWSGIKAKFKPTEDDRIHNLKLTGVVTERSENGRKNKIIGLFAVVVRQSQKSLELKAQAKKGFRVDHFINLPDHLLTEHITKWFTERLASLEDGNATAKGNANKIKEGGSGEDTILLYDAEEFILKKSVWFEQVCAGRSKSMEDGKESLRKFHLHLTENKKYPYTARQITAGFEKWLMNEKKIKDGAKFNSNSASHVGKTLERDRP